MPSLPPYELVLSTPLPQGLRLGVVVHEGKSTSLDFLPSNTPLQPASTAQLAEIEQQLAHYFHNPAAFHTLLLCPKGTAYQQRVWQALRQIPCGEIISYGTLATRLSSSPRAIASACRANPIPLIIPCHRVVAHNGLGGYMGAIEGDAIELKRWLLRHEGAL